VHAGDAGGGRGRGIGLALLDDFLLVRAELPGRGVGVRSRSMLFGQRLLEFRFVGLRQLGFGDLRGRQFLVGLVLAGGQIDLLGRRRPLWWRGCCSASSP
jgi:hypothetical protein